MTDLPSAAAAAKEVERVEKALAVAEWRHWVCDAADTLATALDVDYSDVEWQLREEVEDHLARLKNGRLYRR